MVGAVELEEAGSEVVGAEVVGAEVVGVEVVGLEEEAAEEPPLDGVVQPTREKAKSAETRRTIFLVMC